jgi:hypothetical protein
MFSKKIKPTFKDAKPRRARRKKGDEEDGELWIDVKMEVPLDAKLAKDIGAGAVALLKTKDTNDPKVLPFKKLVLPDEHDGLAFTVFDDNGVKFEVDGCKVRKMQLVRTREDATKAALSWVLKVPPVKQAFRDYLVTALHKTAEVAIVQPQQSLDI